MSAAADRLRRHNGNMAAPFEDDKIRVLMVCLGNICRSPTAEAMLRLKVHEAGLDGRIEVDSAGTADYHVDSPPDRRAIAHGERRGLRMHQLRGRQAGRDDFENFDYVFAMDADNLANLKRIQPKGARAKLGLLLDEAPLLGAREVPDPYYGGADGFERVLDLVDAACAAFVEKVTAGR
jgi:protein-tyrosine phosphatase